MLSCCLLNEADWKQKDIPFPLLVFAKIIGNFVVTVLGRERPANVSETDLRENLFAKNTTFYGLW
jgi:hypothetical protein